MQLYSGFQCPGLSMEPLAGVSNLILMGQNIPIDVKTEIVEACFRVGDAGCTEGCKAGHTAGAGLCELTTSLGPPEIVGEGRKIKSIEKGLTKASGADTSGHSPLSLQ